MPKSLHRSYIPIRCIGTRSKRRSPDGSFRVLVDGDQTFRAEVPVKDVFELANQMAREKFVVGELAPDEWGEIKRVVFPSQRVSMVLEAD